MPMQATCPHCSTIYTLHETSSGKQIHCANCQHDFVVKSAAGRTRGTAPRLLIPGGILAGLVVLAGVTAAVIWMVRNSSNGLQNRQAASNGERESSSAPVALTKPAGKSGPAKEVAPSLPVTGARVCRARRHNR